jgi:hypothetical protein
MAEQKPRAARSRKKTEEAGAVVETTAKRPRVAAAKPAKQPAAKKATTSRSRGKLDVAVRPDEIAVHAYLLWEQGEPGDATDLWLRAERELVAA